MKCLKLYFLTVIVTICILILSLFPVPEMPELEDVPLIDKWVHFVMYGGFLIALWADWVRNGKRPRFLESFLSLVWGCILGGLIEIIQPYVGRSGDVWDFVADAIGCVLGFLIGLAAVRLFPRLYKDRS